MTDFLQDLRYALRTFKRTAGLTVVIVASLAIGIGANTAIFSVVNALLLKPLPYPDPDRLAVLWLRSPGINIPQDWPSPGQYIDVQNENRSFAEMSISQGRSGTLIGRGGEAPFAEPQRVEALADLVEPLPPARRQAAVWPAAACPTKTRRAKPPVVILSYAFWRRVFGADPSIVGKTITLNGFSSAERFQAISSKSSASLAPDFLLNDEIMPTVASIQQMDVFLPLPLRRRRREAPRRRELQPHGAAEAGRDDGAGASATSPPSPRGFARRTSATARSRSTSCRSSNPSSATCGSRCWSCWVR